MAPQTAGRLDMVKVKRRFIRLLSNTGTVCPGRSLILRVPAQFRINSLVSRATLLPTVGRLGLSEPAPIIELPKHLSNIGTVALGRSFRLPPRATSSRALPALHPQIVGQSVMRGAVQRSKHWPSIGMAVLGQLSAPQTSARR